MPACALPWSRSRGERMPEVGPCADAMAPPRVGALPGSPRSKEPGEMSAWLRAGCSAWHQQSVYLCSICESRSTRLDSTRDAHRDGRYLYGNAAPKDVFHRCGDLTVASEIRNQRSLRPTSKQSLNSTRRFCASPGRCKLFICIATFTLEPPRPRAVGSLRPKKLRWP